MSTDFFDDDLLKTGSRRKDLRGESLSARAISEEGLSKMMQQKEEVDTQVVDAVKEIEQLRLRQEQLEKEKKELQELSRKQEEYQAGKRQIIDNLARSILLLEKEEMQAARMVEILSVMRTKFKDTLLELKTIREESWAGADFAMELDKALVIVEDARSVYKKGLAKIEAAGWGSSVSHSERQPFVSSAAITADHRAGFAFWVKVGLAVSLPIIVFLAVLFVAWLYFQGRF
jgi:hypothetical protein